MCFVIVVALGRVTPAHVVVALGTNPADPEEWTRRRLVRTLDLLPATTHVHLLQVVRVGAGRVQRGRDELLRRYDRWHRRIARTRPRTRGARSRGRPSPHRTHSCVGRGGRGRGGMLS